MKNKSIDIIFSRYSPPHFRGGIESYIYYFNKYLQKTSYIPRVITIEENINYEDEFRNILKLKILRIPIIVGLHFQFKLLKYTKHTDIINIHYPTFGVFFKRKKPVLLTLHTLASQEADYYSNNKFLNVLSRKTLTKLLEKITFKKAHHIICLNSELKKSLLKRNVPEEKISVISNGIDTQKFSFIQPRTFNINTPIHFLYVGRLIARKNVSTLIESLSYLKRNDFFLTIIGSGKEEKKLEDYVNKKNLTDNVILKGHKTGSELITEYQNCDVFLLPSFYEGLPFSLLEAQSCGKPAIVGNFSSASSVIQDGWNGYIVKENNEQAFAAVINHILFNKEHIQYMSQKAREQIEKNFSAESKFEETLKQIKNIS